MILTEIKHLNVQISEFEEPIFDQNILPIFITPLILKEVEIRKKSKHKIETLNPEKKLNFRSVSINVIVEELAARINKIALDLEPNYFIDPSYYNSLPYDVRVFLKKNTLKEEKKVIAEASYRIALSTLRGKKHILYARCRIIKRRYKYKHRHRYRQRNRKSYKALYRYKKNKKQRQKRKTLYGSYSEAANVRGKNIKPILKKKNINKYRKLNFFPVTLRSATTTLTKPSGLGLRKLTLIDGVNVGNNVVASSSAALQRAANHSKNQQVEISSTKNLTAPKQVNKVTFFNNASDLRSQQGSQPTNIGRLRTLSRLKQNLQNLASSNQTVPVRQVQIGDSQLLFSGWIPTSKGALMLLEDEGWDLDLLSNRNKASQRLKKIRPYSLRKLRRLRRLRRLRLMSINLYLHRSNNAKKNNFAVRATSTIRAGLNTPASNLSQKRRGLRDRLYSNLEKQVANLDNQGRNNSNITKFHNKAATHAYLEQSQMLTLGTCQGLTFTNRCAKDGKMQPINLNKSLCDRKGANPSSTRPAPVSTYRASEVQSRRDAAPIAAGLHVSGGLNNNYLVKRNNNKLNFIINWIGDNFSYSGYLKSYSYISNYSNYSNNSNSFVHTRDSDSILRAQKVQPVAAGNAALSCGWSAEGQQPQLPLTQEKVAKVGSDECSYATTLQQNKSTDININTYKPALQSTLLIDQFFTNTPPQRLNKRNIRDIFLVQTKKPIKLPTLEELESPELTVLNKKQKALAGVALYKAAEVKATENAKLYWEARKTKFLRRRFRKQPKKNWVSQKHSALLRTKRGSFGFQVGGAIRPSRANFAPYLLWGKATLAQSQSKANITSRLSAIKTKVKNWKKKKDLSTVLLEKTWQRYVNLQLRNINLFSDTNLPVNWKLVEGYYAKLYIKKLNRLKLLAKVTRPKAWEKIAALLKIGIATSPSIYGEGTLPKKGQNPAYASTPITSPNHTTRSSQLSVRKASQKKVKYPDPLDFVRNLPSQRDPNGRPLRTPAEEVKAAKLAQGSALARGSAALRSEAKVAQSSVLAQGSRTNQPKSRSTRRRTRLFWAIIKLYSSSFNPIFNSLNNKYLTLPTFFGKSTAQIQILKNNSGYSNNNNDHFSPIELTAKEHSATLIEGWKPAVDNGPLRSGKGLKTILGTGAVKMDNKPTQAKVTKGTKLAKAVHNSQAVSDPLFVLPSIPLSRSKPLLIQGQQLLPQAGNLHLSKLMPVKKGGKGPGIQNSNVTVVPFPHTVKTKANSVALALHSKPTTEYNVRSVTSSHLTDNKRFLFLYFIVPIFFATLKNSLAGARAHPSAIRSAQSSFSADEVSVSMQSVPLRAPVQAVTVKPIKTKESHNLPKPELKVDPLLAQVAQAQQRRVEKRTLKNLTNQRKQLRALIKLMLNSGTALRRSRQWIRRNRAFPDIRRKNIHPYISKAQHSTRVLTKGSDNVNLWRLTEGANLRLLQNNKIKLGATHRSAKAGSVVKVQKNSKEVVSQLPCFSASLSPALTNHNLRSRSTDLLKWSVSLIAQSLAPLKSKNEYYSLMFLNILKTKGFLNLKKNQKKKIKASHKLQQQGYGTNQQSRTHANKVEGTAAHSKHLDLQDKNKISLPKKGKVKPAATVTESDTNKIPLLTYYPGGRYMSDWKRITKVIWQEEYKFNAVYRRAKNSLKLTKINTKKNLKNRYTIITVLKLWNMIKITSIKSVASLKLQVNFIKYAGATLPVRVLGNANNLLPLNEQEQNLRVGTRAQLRRTPVKTYSLLAAKMLCWKHLGVEYPHLPLRCSGTPASRTGTTTAAQHNPALQNPSDSLTFSAKRAQLLVKRKTPTGSITSPASDKLTIQNFNKKVSVQPLKKQSSVGKYLAFDRRFIMGWLQKARSNAIYNGGTTNKKKYKKLKNVIKTLDATIKKKKRTATVLRLLRIDELTKDSGQLRSSLPTSLLTQQNRGSETRANVYYTGNPASRRQGVQSELHGWYAPSSYGGQENFLENLKYVIIKLTLSVLETMEIKNRARLLSIRHRSLIKPDKLNSLLYDSGGSYLVKKTEDIIAYILQQHFSFTFYDNYISWIKLNKFFKLREATNATSLNKKLTWLIKYIDSQVPLIFSIHRLDPFKKLGFLSKNISLTVTATFLPSLMGPTGPTGLTLAKEEVGKKKITNLQSQAAKNFTLIRNIEFYKNFNNLVNAKLTIIGKIRSIKLVELLDKIKENIIKDEELAALKRVADITNLNLVNKKKSRSLNSSKYLNKKKIVLSNRIKILQTVETIKTDFRFEPKLDSNALSKTPVSLLYYSNLQPLVNSGSVKYAEHSSLRSVQQRGHGFNQQSLSREAERVSAAADATAQTIEAERSSPPVLSSYLRELSIYNRETKGVINYFSKIVSYNFNANNNKISSSITDLLEASFKAMHCLISKPVFVITPKKVTIQLFYFLMVANKKKLKKIRRRSKSRFNNKGKQRIFKIYKKKRLIEAKNLNLYKLNEVFSEQFELLCGRLNKIFNKPVELNLIRLHYPTEDSNILANFMDILINKVALAKIYKKVFKGSIIKTLITLKKRKYNDISIIPAFLTGLNIKIAGRIMTQKIKPRKTINLKHRGVTAKGKINYLNFARLTNKNKRGSYSITVSAGQNYFK